MAGEDDIDADWGAAMAEQLGEEGDGEDLAAEWGAALEEQPDPGSSPG